VCRQLGFSGVENVYYYSRFGDVTPPFSFLRLKCNGKESNLAECYQYEWNDHCFESYEGAGVNFTNILPQPLCALIPRAKNDSYVISIFLRFWDLHIKALQKVEYSNFCSFAKLKTRSILYSIFHIFVLCEI